MGEICNYPPTINFFTLQRFIIRDKRSVCLIVSFFIAKKLKVTDGAFSFWKITTARGPPFLSEIEKQIRIRKEEKDERTRKIHHRY